MLKTLIKKQFSELFKGFFYNAKKNTARTKGNTIFMFALFAFIMFVVSSGSIAALDYAICIPFIEAEVDWLYFLIMGGISVLVGAIGSICSTFSGLYLSKDNDLLLSMPMPLRYIIGTRLMGVYIMGAIFTLIVMAPTCIVYWICSIGSGDILLKVICGLIFTLVITIIVFILSCLLGFVVARISKHVRNKSLVTILASLAFIGLYYFTYFRASSVFQDLAENAAKYGGDIREAVYLSYAFGSAATGDIVSALISLAIVLAVMFLVCFIISKSFISIATSSGAVGGTKYVEKKAKEDSPFGALLHKELSKLVSSANYMLNCGIGAIFLILVGAVLVIKSDIITATAASLLGDNSPLLTVLLFAALCALSSATDTAAPSVSLEGKNIWIPQSLPVHPKYVLRAKAMVQILLSSEVMLVASLCVIVVFGLPLVDSILFILGTQLYIVLSAILGTVISVKMPNLTWTNEIVPIKQSGAVMISLFGGWVFSAIVGGVYYLLFNGVSAMYYLLGLCIVFIVLIIVLLHWLDTKGAEAFAEL